jgi:hypothetical protein
MADLHKMHLKFVQPPGGSPMTVTTKLNDDGSSEIELQGSMALAQLMALLASVSRLVTAATEEVL